MASLLGKQVGHILVEVLGPQDGRNHFTLTTAPTVEIQVFGTGSVIFEENTDHVLVGERASNIGSQKAYNTEKYADPAGWSPVGAAITAANGLVIRSPLTVGTTDPTWLRLRVVTVGDGDVHFATKWR